jgi:hypothetical protein
MTAARLGPASADALEHGAPGVEAVVPDGQLDVLPGRLDIEGHFRPGLAAHGAEEFIAEPECLTEFRCDGHDTLASLTKSDQAVTIGPQAGCHGHGPHAVPADHGADLLVPADRTSGDG